MRIENKTQMFALMKCGLLGNRMRFWTSDEEFKRASAEGFDRLVGIRCSGVNGLPYHHHKTHQEAIVIGGELRRRHNCDVVYFEASQDEFITIQGEISDLPHGYELEYTTVRDHMRKAFAKERISVLSERIPAIVRASFNERSLDDLLWTFDTYPGCTVEFSAYEILVGNLRCRNVVVWEVRHY